MTIILVVGYLKIHLVLVVTELWQARLCEWFHKVNQKVSAGLTQAHKPEVSGSIPLPATKTFSSSIKQTCQFCRFKPKVEHIITIINLFVTLVWHIFSIWSGKGEIISGDYTITLRDFCVKLFLWFMKIQLLFYIQFILF